MRLPRPESETACRGQPHSSLLAQERFCNAMCDPGSKTLVHAIIERSRKNAPAQAVDETPNADTGFRDPAFMANRDAPVHRWVPWIAGYSRQFVEDALETRLDGYGTVLDPFAGVGTTLVEADRAGHEAVGFEINPYATFAARIKLAAHRIDPESLRAVAGAFRAFMETAEHNGTRPRAAAPAGFRTRVPFYSPKVLRKVLLVQDFIDSMVPKSAVDPFRLAFAATMVSYSNYSYEPSLGRKTAVGRAEIEDFSVAEAIASKVCEMAGDAERHRAARDRRPRKDGRVFDGSFFDGYRNIPEASVDLLVTSPPYLNNYHYNRNTRPHLYWLGFCAQPHDMKRLETLNFGTYWQNARDRDRVDLDPTIHDDEIRGVIDEVRRKNPEKGIYGGSGWANYAALYFNDCVRFAAGAIWCLRPGARALVVIGNSILQGIPIPTDRFLAKIAAERGLEVVDIHIPRDTRVGSSIVASSVRVGKAANGTRLYESVVELRRP